MSAVTRSSLFASIPPRYSARCSSQLVKQVVITKAAHAVTSTVSGITVAAPPNRRLSKMGTSKLHKFKPSVSLAQALEWLSEFGPSDSTIMFESDDSIIFEAGKFIEYEGDEEDEQLNENRDNQASLENEEEEEIKEENEDERAPVETFQVGKQ
jgi:hypothetical protein